MQKLMIQENQRYDRLLVLGHNAIVDKHNKIQYVCECTCGRIVSVAAGRLINKVSRSCGCLKQELHHRDLTGQKMNSLTILEKVGQDKHGSYLYKCACDCGKIKNIRGTNITGGRILSCGCVQKAVVKKMCQGRIADKHPNWQGGITTEYTKVRNSTSYAEWRLSVFQRDNFECQRCFRHEKKINAHHLMGFSKNKELRLDINNGICLCEGCHIEFHQIFGKNNNTTGQYEQWVYGND